MTAGRIEPAEIGESVPAMEERAQRRLAEGT